MQGGNGLSLETVVRFDWEVALGDQKLTLGELEALARMKAPLVRVRGQWVEMSAQEIQAAIDFWKKKEAGEATVRDIVRMALGAGEAPESLDFNGVSATGWIGRLLDQLDGVSEFKEAAPPDGFSGTLRPYQVRGYSWLSFLRQWGLGACLADDMGLGKTVQTLALIQRDWQANGKRPVLLLCPTTVVNNWRKEANRFTPQLPVLVHHGPGRKRGAAFKKEAERHAIVISSYALAHRDIRSLREAPWSGVVLDEAQNIKNPETMQAQAARSLEADYRIALTGTPVENNVGDLWSIMEFPEPRFPGLPERVQAHVLRAYPGRAGRGRGRAPQAHHRPFHPPKTQDGQNDHRRPAGEAGDEGLLPAHERTGVAVRLRSQADGRGAGVRRGHPAERADPRQRFPSSSRSATTRRNSWATTPAPPGAPASSHG